MRRIVLVLLLLVLIVAAIAQTQGSSRKPDNEITFGLKNGRFWNRIGSPATLYYVIGLDDGKHGHCKVDEYKYTNMTYRDLTTGVDQFYKDAANIRIPVVDAIEIFKMKVRGAPEERIQDALAKIRRLINVPESTK